MDLDCQRTYEKEFVDSVSLDAGYSREEVGENVKHGRCDDNKVVRSNSNVTTLWTGLSSGEYGRRCGVNRRVDSWMGHRVVLRSGCPCLTVRRGKLVPSYRRPGTAYRRLSIATVD